MSEKVHAHLSINVGLGVKLKIPEFELSYGLFIIIWRDNRSSGSNRYALHFASCEKWMILTKDHINQSHGIK